MRPAENIEKLIKNINIETNTIMDEAVLSEVVKAFEESKKLALSEVEGKETADVQPSIWRIIMKSRITKLATAAVIIVAVMLGMYALTGSVDGTSITIAQVRQAMQEIDWMQITNRSKIEEGTETDWYSFTSKVEIKADNKGRLSYSDFKTHKDLFWPGQGNFIYESSIETKEFAYGTSGPFEIIDKSLRLVQAKHGSEVIKELGTYDGQKVEVWTAKHVIGKSGSTVTIIVYIDIDKKLPIAATYKRVGTDTINPEENYIEFKYPQTGPADIYEAGAPRSAQIKPSPEQ